MRFGAMSTGVEDACDTVLVLGLGRCYPSPPKSKSSSSNHKLLDPSLTLGLSDDSHRTSPSTAYSSINIKRENDMASEEAERGVSSRASEEDEEGGARKKLRLTKGQSALLENKFKEHTSLNPKQKQALAKQLNLRPRQVEVWFQNRRARTKLKQTEVDCEVLKRCCENLRDENKRLKKELEELRALKVGPTPPPVYVQPAVCPSCERVRGPAVLGEAAKVRAFIVGPPAAQLLNPFARSAAC